MLGSDSCTVGNFGGQGITWRKPLSEDYGVDVSAGHAESITRRGELTENGSGLIV